MQDADVSPGSDHDEVVNIEHEYQPGYSRPEDETQTDGQRMD